MTADSQVRCYTGTVDLLNEWFVEVQGLEGYDKPYRERFVGDGATQRAAQSANKWRELLAIKDD